MGGLPMSNLASQVGFEPMLARRWMFRAAPMARVIERIERFKE